MYETPLMPVPSKSVNAGCLLFDATDRLMIVRHTYVDAWGLPGGVVEVDESPPEGCRREVREELGLHVQQLTLVAIDYRHANASRAEYVRFLFLGPRLTDPAGLVLQRTEVSEARLVAVDDALNMLTVTLAQMISRVRSAAVFPIYLEDGRRP